MATPRRLGIIINGATGGLAGLQHLPALIAIRDEGGLALRGGVTSAYGGDGGHGGDGGRGGDGGTGGTGPNVGVFCTGSAASASLQHATYQRGRTANTGVDGDVFGCP